MVTLDGPATRKADALGDYGAVKALGGLENGGAVVREGRRGALAAVVREKATVPEDYMGRGDRGAARSRLETKVFGGTKEGELWGQGVGVAGPRMLMVTGCAVKRWRFWRM